MVETKSQVENLSLTTLYPPIPKFNTLIHAKAKRNLELEERKHYVLIRGNINIQVKVKLSNVLMIERVLIISSKNLINSLNKKMPYLVRYILKSFIKCF